MDEELLLLLILHSFGALCFILYILISLFGSKSNGGFPPSTRALIVVAHPDDEVMFFGPTIANLCRQGGDVSLHLLVLSTGNYRGQGDQRKEELYRAAESLSIPKGNITLLSYTKLQDDPKARWSEELLAEILTQYVESQDIDVVLSFDRHGVSGHKNHSSIYNALLLLKSEERGTRFRSPKILVLNSVNILRKYSGIFDLPMSYALSPISFIASPRDWLHIQKAMSCYGSQYAWFRKAYMAFSRYVLINTYDILK
eukprot:TRINITY_DN1497_c0_g1_i1.p1 TRINITY_DN1497_c0_g1~~TRINITY_DN1497_c0_g1_i1.p1  ORF type:complete len:256 (+),score=91.23 TRINITY_DN1497_c0_g1_i1:497-1264(+)